VENVLFNYQPITNWSLKTLEKACVQLAAMINSLKCNWKKLKFNLD